MPVSELLERIEGQNSEAGQAWSLAQANARPLWTIILYKCNPTFSGTRSMGGLDNEKDRQKDRNWTTRKKERKTERKKAREKERKKEWKNGKTDGIQNHGLYSVLVR